MARLAIELATEGMVYSQSGSDQADYALGRKETQRALGKCNAQNLCCWEWRYHKIPYSKLVRDQYLPQNILKLLSGWYVVLVLAPSYKVVANLKSFLLNHDQIQMLRSTLHPD
jgi:hypothetical protein